MKQEYRVVRRIKGVLINPAGDRIIDHVDAALLEAVSKPMTPIPLPDLTVEEEEVDSTD